LFPHLIAFKTARGHGFQLHGGQIVELTFTGTRFHTNDLHVHVPRAMEK